jgi:DNA-binding IclR family transcriptional regulator
MLTNKSTERYLVPAVDQATRILFCLAESESTHMGLLEISDKVNINKSKVYAIMITLQKFGLIRRNVDGKGYALGPGLISLSRKVLDNFNIPKLAEPALEELSKKTGCTVSIGLIAEDKVFIAAKHEASPDFSITARIGHQYPLTYGCHGKAIAAALPKDELDELLQEDTLYFHGSPEKLDRKRLKKELAQCRIDGYASDLGEIRPGLNIIAAAILGPNRSPIGYITLLGMFKVESIKIFGPMVAEIGRNISEQLGVGIN